MFVQQGFGTVFFLALLLLILLLVVVIVVFGFDIRAFFASLHELRCITFLVL